MVIIMMIGQHFVEKVLKLKTSRGSTNAIPLGTPMSTNGVSRRYYVTPLTIENAINWLIAWLIASRTRLPIQPSSTNVGTACDEN